MDDIYRMMGLVGVAFYLGSYGLLQAGVLRGSSYVYTGMNLVAASLVLVSLAADFNLSSAIIQVSWITISILGMTRVWVLTRNLTFSEEEEALISDRFPTMRRSDARRFLKAGAWHVGGRGEVLTTEGQPVERLAYILRGQVDIMVKSRVIAQAGPGDFIGEMGCLSRSPASATVRLKAPTRYFSITTEALSRLIRRDPEFAVLLEGAFANHTRSKLVATNALLEQALGQQNADRAPNSDALTVPASPPS